MLPLQENNTTTCVLKDDMRKIHQALEDSEGLIVATPIYFAGVTAQTKTWVDRMFPYIDMKLNSRLPKGQESLPDFHTESTRSGALPAGHQGLSIGHEDIRL